MYFANNYIIRILSFYYKILLLFVKDISNYLKGERLFPWKSRIFRGRLIHRVTYYSKSLNSRELSSRIRSLETNTLSRHALPISTPRIVRLSHIYRNNPPASLSTHQSIKVIQFYSLEKYSSFAITPFLPGALTIVAE